MNLIEERIRAAASAAADTVAPDSVPPLELPAARPRRFGRRTRGARSPGVRWSTWGPWLAPWAAAAAIIALVITLVNVGPPPTQGGPSGTTGSSLAGPPGIPAGPPVSSYIRSGQIPRFYVTLTPPDAVVHLTENGATLGTIRPSLPGGTVIAVTAAADDRTFVLAEQSQDRTAVAFYQVRLGSSGRPGALTRLPVSVAAGGTMTGVALSPDGTKIAIAIGFQDGLQQIRVAPVRGGPARDWTGRGGTIGTQFATRSLSWTADQHTLAFNWSVGQTSSVRLLNPDGPGGDLAGASRPALTLPHSASTGQALYQCGYLTITADGSELVCASGTITKIAKNGVSTYITGFPEFSTATGRLTRIAGHWSQPQNDGKGEPRVILALWPGTSGRVLIGVIRSADRNWVGVISGNTFTPLNAQWIATTAAVDFGAW
jgi:hypothetical protein